MQQVALRGTDSAGAWKPMANKFGAVWELAAAPQPPLDVRITCDNNETVRF